MNSTTSNHLLFNNDNYSTTHGARTPGKSLSDFSKFSLASHAIFSVGGGDFSYWITGLDQVVGGWGVCVKGGSHWDNLRKWGWGVGGGGERQTAAYSTTAIYNTYSHTCIFITSYFVFPVVNEYHLFLILFMSIFDYMHLSRSWLSVPAAWKCPRTLLWLAAVMWGPSHPSHPRFL